VARSTATTSLETRLVFQNFLPCRFKAINEKSLRLLANTHESLGISAPEFGIMVILSEHDDVSSRDINKTTGIDKATITRALDRLIDKNLISRVRSKKDSRLVKLKLTAKGKRTFAQIEEDALAWEREFVKGVRINELNSLLNILGKLDANLERLDES
jgi:DNA-binding MarR family transcriptional regulator